MEHITLKGTDLTVSPVCLGTWQFNDGQQNNTWPAQKLETSQAITDKCFELGINFFDTAEAYKGSEQVLGKTLIGRRQNAVIATKFSKKAYSAQEIDEAVTKSLQNLQTTYIDILQVHYPVVLKDFKDAVAELNRQVSLGRIRYYGLSNFGPRRLKEFIDAGGKPVTHQIGYSLLWRSPEHAMIPDTIKYGINMLAYSPLQQGLLTGKFSKLSDVPEGRRRGKLFSRDSTPLSKHDQDGAEEEVDEALKKIREICKEAGVEMSKAPLSWILQQDGMDIVIVGASSPVQVAENSKMIKLENDVIRQLSEATEPVKMKIGNTLDQWIAVDRCL